MVATPFAKLKNSPACGLTWSLAVRNQADSIRFGRYAGCQQKDKDMGTMQVRLFLALKMHTRLLQLSTCYLAAKWGINKHIQYIDKIDQVQKPLSSNLKQSKPPFQLLQYIYSIKQITRSALVFACVLESFVHALALPSPNMINTYTPLFIFILIQSSFALG